MEPEPQSTFIVALKSAYDGMMQRGDWSEEAFMAHIDPLLLNLSEADRDKIQSSLLSEDVDQKKFYTYRPLAWHIQPWTSGS